MNSTDFFDLLSENPERFLALLKKLGIELWDAQKEAYRAAFKYPEVYVRTANATGKCLALDTPLPTPSGWTTMGEVAVGDTLFDEEGNQCRVVQAFAPFLADAYRVEFDDGTSIVADGEHLWRAFTYNDKTQIRRRDWGKHKSEAPLYDWRNAWDETRVVSTDEMRASLRWRRGTYNWFIPCAREIKTEKTDLQTTCQTARTVTNIVPVGKRFVRCIKVDSPRHLYLAGEGFVPTHNTFLSGVLGVAFLFCYRPSKVIYIATKIEQSQRQSWMEFLRIYWKVREFLAGIRDSPLVLPEPLAHKLNLGDDWFATVWGGSHADPEAYHGFHGRNMLIIIDEASGIDDEIRIAVDRCLTGKNNHLVALGNPLRRVGWFYADQQKTAKHRKVLHISALDSPNVVAGREVVPGLVTAEKIQQRREEYGEASAFWQSAVLGEFPQEASEALIPWNAIDMARVRHIEPDYGRLSIGVDVARQGKDQSVIVVLAGDTVVELDELSKHDTMAVAGWVLSCLRRLHMKTVAVDGTGIGAGVIDRLREEGINVLEWQSGGASRRPEVYLNAKADWGMDLRERFMRGRIAIPDHPRLMQELAAWEIDFMGDGRLKIVDPPKSPDYADALLIAHWAQGPATLKEKIVSGGETYTAKLAW